MKNDAPSYHGYRFPPEIISHAVWLYHRFSVSFRVDEPVSGYSKRPVARNEAAAKELKTRTLTNLYNARPQCLADAHTTLDAAVAAAYCWESGIADNEALRELLALNLESETAIVMQGNGIQRIQPDEHLRSAGECSCSCAGSKAPCATS